MKNIYLLLTILGTICLLSSCESSYIHLDDEGTYIIDTTSPIDTIKFQTDIVPIIQVNCASCHTSETPPDLTTSDTYSILMDGNYIDTETPEISTFFILPWEGHADDYLTAEEHIAIINWIEQGALNN